jgi:hypothetical protein
MQVGTKVRIVTELPGGFTMRDIHPDYTTGTIRRIDKIQGEPDSLTIGFTRKTDEGEITTTFETTDVAVVGCDRCGECVYEHGYAESPETCWVCIEMARIGY